MSAVYQGQLRKGYLRPVVGVSEAVRFKFQPLWPMVYHKFRNDLRKAKEGDETLALFQNAMLWQVKEWNLTYPADHPDTEKAGQPMPISMTVIKVELDPIIAGRIASIVTGFAEMDVDPEWETEEQVKAIQERGEKSFLETISELDAATVGN